MPGDHFWLCVEALSTTFDGDHHTVDENLNLYTNHLRHFSAERREEFRRQIMQIIGGLAQLQARMGTLDE
jgi:hypothetical protein